MSCATQNKGRIDIIEAFRKQLRALSGALQWSDILFLIYLMVVARQYLWALDSQAAAWIASGIIGVVMVSIHVIMREPIGNNPSIDFWLIVGLPLVAVFLLRLPFPDMNFDQMGYHLVNSNRALWGWPFKLGDFFPGVLLANPAPDMVMGVGRLLLGYRLGTVINLLAVLWAAVSIELLFRDYIASKVTRSLAVLFAISTEHLLYLLNLYMIDLLALPLLIEALRLAVNLQKLHNRRYSIVHIALFIGIAIAFKLTNIAIATPIIAVVIAEVAKDCRSFGSIPIITAFVVLFAPILPFSLYLYAEVGSPIFPYYNNIFQSPYFPPRTIRDVLRGPESLFETLWWPILALLKPTRISAMSHGQHYLGKLSIAYLFALGALFVGGLDRQVRVIMFCMLAMTVLWSFSSGDIRYAIPIEVMGGILMVCLMSAIWQKSSHAVRNKWPKLVFAVLALQMCVVGVLALQTCLIFRRGVVHQEWYTRDEDWDSISQPTAVSQPLLYVRGLEYVFLDRDPRAFIDKETAQALSKIEIWINSIDATSGVEVASRPEVPIISLGKYISIFDYMESPASRDRLRATLERVRDKRMFTLVQVPDLAEAIPAIQQSGLHVIDSMPIEIPFYSPTNRLKFLMMQVAL